MGLLAAMCFDNVFSVVGDRLVRRYDDELLWIEPWGKDSLRVRATKMARMPDEDWALLPPEECRAQIRVGQEEASIQHGRIRAVCSAAGRLRFEEEGGRLLLEEFTRNRWDVRAKDCSALNIEARELRPIPGGDYALTARFESNPNERIYGMGQYQMPYLDLKGCELELAQRNSQASVPFAVSSLGYGFLWNNPAIGRAAFNKNLSLWQAQVTTKLDYWITAGRSVKEICRNYARATGYAPAFPEEALGFWQSKLRYQTQEELLGVAREFKRRGLPLSVIVADFFHWPNQGDWKFDEEYWPDPAAMTRELGEMGVQLMVSVWPTVEKSSENHQEMLSRGLLVRMDRGIRAALEHRNHAVHFDATNPEARAFVWDKVRRNYLDKGVSLFWLDEAEPEYTRYDFDIFRYHLGTDLQVGNIYPALFAKTFYDGLKASGVERPLSLVRCAWAGSQRYGALVWSGDIHSTFESLRNQLAAGLNMGMAGIPWWTTDIGGFHGGDPEDPAFRELLTRWFQWGVFCPVMRIHGDREPTGSPLGPSGGGKTPSGAANEPWSFGQRTGEILRRCLLQRQLLRPYLARTMDQAHEKGDPPMRAMFYEFPEDPRSWEAEDQYMLGEDLLVAPVFQAGQTQRKVYLPAGASWVRLDTGEVLEGGRETLAQAPLERIPVFARQGAQLGFTLEAWQGL